MVGGHVPVPLLVIFQKRKLGNPAVLICLLRNQTLFVGEFRPQKRECAGDDGRLIGHDKDRIPGPGIERARL